MASCVVQVRLDEKVKQKADKLFDDLGFDTPTAIRIFLAQAIKNRGLPFDVRQITNNAETLEAIEEIEEHIKSG
ncbi:MAG: type II toxin-antitoxin system RelB/DinJ family antitoxin [Oscillospiraceae bacterium]|jgi:DNA-damage-inducible protein J|nr:type II toxin-antitoxin system RelB/DinJ family antitoxin [Oscillospiraceae bacterium]